LPAITPNFPCSHSLYATRGRSLDKVIKTMKGTGADMSVKHEETARGGLAANIEC
jgi:L-serine deaminase